jgi:hypothetical protein
MSLYDGRRIDTDEEDEDEEEYRQDGDADQGGASLAPVPQTAPFTVWRPRYVRARWQACLRKGWYSAGLCFSI